jgi:hypothetical protein
MVLNTAQNAEEIGTLLHCGVEQISTLQRRGCQLSEHLKNRNIFIIKTPSGSLIDHLQSCYNLVAISKDRHCKHRVSLIPCLFIYIDVKSGVFVNIFYIFSLACLYYMAHNSYANGNGETNWDFLIKALCLDHHEISFSCKNRASITIK